MYGLVVPQFRDIDRTFIDGNRTEIVREYLKSYFSFKDDFLGVVVGIIVGIAILFVAIFTVSIKVFNFQRW